VRARERSVRASNARSIERQDAGLDAAACVATDRADLVAMADVTYPLIQGATRGGGAASFLLLTVHDYKVKMNMI